MFLRHKAWLDRTGPDFLHSCCHAVSVYKPQTYSCVCRHNAVMCEVCCTDVWTVGSSPAWESDSGPGFEVCWSTGSGRVRELAADKEEFGSVDSQDYELFISSCSSDQDHYRSEPTWFWWFWLVRTHLQAEPPRCLLPPPLLTRCALTARSLVSASFL